METTLFPYDNGNLTEKGCFGPDKRCGLAALSAIGL